MTQFDPPIEKRTTDQLVIIANSNTDDWQKEAILLANSELLKRGLSSEDQKRRFIELEQFEKLEFRKELERRKVEDYSIVEMIFIVLRWPIYLFSDWRLKKDGFHLKHKRRLQLLLLGAILTVFFLAYVKAEYEKDHVKRLEEIENIDISDWEERRK